MKWRHSLIYLLILALLGGYYYYFEVVQKRKKEESERAKNRLFSVATEAVDEIILEAKDKPALHVLKKDGAWVLDRPVRTEADQSAVDTLVHSLVHLEKNREVDQAAKDMALYGLSEPTLVVRFRSGETWHHIRFGSKNPTEESHYAAKGDENAVFLLAAGSVKALNKGLDELRRRDLLTFEDEEVRGLSVSWADGHRLTLARDEKDKELWRCPEEPERRVKRAKVDNILNQIRWARAKTFLELPAEDSQVWSSGAADVHVILQGGDGPFGEVKIGRKKDDPETTVAWSSQMSSLVTVDGAIVKELPKTVRDVEDRSVVVLDSKNVTRVQYRIRGDKGELVLQDDGSWAYVGADGSRRMIKESWRVRPVFWEWEDLEYEEKAPADAQRPEEQDLHRLEFSTKDGATLTVSWPGANRDESAPTFPLWTGSGEAYLVKGEKIRAIEEKILDVLKRASDKASS
ncbi:DUF4340 domain-containing protein [Desulfosoma sp.]